MIIFNKKQKDLNIPKGIGNAPVNIMSGNTDTVNISQVNAAVNAKSAQDRAYAAQIAEENAESALTQAENYAENQAILAVESAKTYTDEAIAEASTDFWIRGYTQAWNSNTEDIEALFQKIESMVPETTVINSKMWGLRVFINHGGYGVAHPFTIDFIEPENGHRIGLLRLGWTGYIYPYDNAITAIYITIHRGQPIAQGDVHENRIFF